MGANKTFILPKETRNHGLGGEKLILLDYDLKATNRTIIETWSEIFDNSDQDRCPVKRCILKSKRCGEDYTRDFLKLSNSTTSFGIQAFNGEFNGYSEEACYECTNGEQTIHQHIQVS